MLRKLELSAGLMGHLARMQTFNYQPCACIIPNSNTVYEINSMKTSTVVNSYLGLSFCPVELPIENKFCNLSPDQT